MPTIPYGVHLDMPSEVYHALPGVSATKLKKLHGSTPAHLKAYLDAKQTESTALIKGTMAHAIILEPDKPLPGLAIEPEEYAPGKKWTYAANACKEWRATQEAAGLMVLSRKEHQEVFEMARAIAKHPVAGDYFRSGQAEVSVVVHDQLNDIPVRCRFDWIPEVPNVICDLKTTRDASESGFTRLAYDLGYHIQAALYIDMWAAVAGKDDPRMEWKFIAVESDAPFAVNVFNASEEFIARGREHYTDAIALFAKCVRENSWPAYTPTEKQLNLPNWAKTR